MSYTLNNKENVDSEASIEFRYAGTASINRFERELKSLARLCNGVLSEDDTAPRFKFNEAIDPIVVHWFNDAYAAMSIEDTRIVQQFVKPIVQADKVAYQICYELDKCVAYGDGWCLS